MRFAVESDEYWGREDDYKQPLPGARMQVTTETEKWELSDAFVADIGEGLPPRGKGRDGGWWGGWYGLYENGHDVSHLKNAGGYNHRREGNVLLKEMDVVTWYIEISTPEQIADIAKSFKCPVAIYAEEDKYPLLHILTNHEL